ncbi:MAG TPA: regulatory iron-sulfur-containing complex subunit RicT [Thermoleophilia bacterium]|nr:regulatory iron-sulfur-containing complex subunit RicT [Thermoleophilia bacterium]HQJ27496.1 regulatory iron-sulfur-containing complex subunit RicT [Thermoleophilia bacterium]
MPRICSVVFRGGGKVFDFNAGRLDLAPGDGVVVDTARGADYGRVVRGPGEVGEEDAPRGLRKVLRKATPADLETIASHREIEVEAKREGRRLARELGLDVKIVEARQAFDDTRLGITFYAEERTDTRELQSRLAERLGRRVELKQVSARDESRIVGGYGPCGRSLCCATFAGDQDPVSIRMAKDQDLPLNPTKISGCCGRLMCCLKYEHQVYVSFRKRAPKRGTVVRTPAGEGKVTDLLAPLDGVTVDLGEGRSATFKLEELGSPAPAGRNDHG